MEGASISNYKAISSSAGIAYLVCLAAVFGQTLLNLARLAVEDDLTSHALLVPVICAYLAWTMRGRVPPAPSGARWPGVVLALVGPALLAVRVPPGDALSLRVFAFVVLLWAGGFLALGAGVMRAVAFPAAFLVFMVPLPSGLVAALETFFQYTSAEVAYQFINWSGTAVLREGLTFTMPGIALHVGPECSGIRSSFVLFMTALLAGHMFLRSNWSRLVFALFVVPLGIVRNAFRVFVLAMLSVHVHPSYIDSPIHHKGGPIFFALSLLPFFLVLGLLRWLEGARASARRGYQ